MSLRVSGTRTSGPLSYLVNGFFSAKKNTKRQNVQAQTRQENIMKKKNNNQQTKQWKKTNKQKQQNKTTKQRKNLIRHTNWWAIKKLKTNRI